MKQLTGITLVLITAVMFASVSYGNHTVNQFGLIDSCWQVFLSQLPGGDSSLGAFVSYVCTMVIGRYSA